MSPGVMGARRARAPFPDSQASEGIAVPQARGSAPLPAELPGVTGLGTCRNPAGLLRVRAVITVAVRRLPHQPSSHLKTTCTE